MISPDLDWVPDEDSFTANQIDLICDEFESIWKSEDRPQISDYLYRVEEPSRSALLVELVRLDYAYRLEKGETPSSEEYVSLFPDYSDVLLTRVNEFSSIGKEVSEAPSKIGDIELLEIAGFGAFGTVWKAWDLELKRQVAVKLPSNKLDGKQQVDLFLHEAQAAAKLHHPNIVPVYSSGQIDGRGYIVFKYIQGETLRALLNKRALAHEQAAQICLALAAGLDHAHQQGVIHRDLKPSNILIDETGQPHITDFGLAKRIDVTASLAHSGTVLGTLAYMSPEQAKGRSSEIEAHSDIYSLGAILYRMLTNQIPFEGEPHEVLQRIINQEPVAPRKIEPSIPRDLETIFLKAISKSKRDRYQTAGELATDLKRFLDQKPIHSRRVSFPGRIWRKVKQKPIANGLYASLACVFTALAFQILLPTPAVLADTPIVTLNTKPEGAQVAFIPLSKKNGEPMPEQIVHAETTSPVTLPLNPGDYLVVAYFNDQRFHEVYRHVPASNEGIPLYLRHRFYSRNKENSNLIKLIEIEIPTDHNTNGMAWIDGKHRFPVGNVNSTTNPHHHRSMPGFWIDTTELNVMDYIRLSNSKPRKPTYESHKAEYEYSDPQMAVALNYDMAVHLAEKSGKRLLSEFEFEYAATHASATEFPWNNNQLDQKQTELEIFLPVGQPEFDQLATQPPVFGMYSNVAEWTSSQLSRYPQSTTDRSLETLSSHQQHRVVRGGSRTVINGDPGITREMRDPRKRTPIPRTEVHSGLGVRFARSQKPRLKPEDFIHIVK